MVKLRHPFDFSSVEEYLKELRSARETVTVQLEAALRKGTCTDPMLNMLKYIWIMHFWTEASQITTAEAGETLSRMAPALSGSGPFLLIDNGYKLKIDNEDSLLI